MSKTQGGFNPYESPSQLVDFVMKDEVYHRVRDGHVVCFCDSQGKCYKPTLSQRFLRFGGLQKLAASHASVAMFDYVSGSNYYNIVFVSVSMLTLLLAKCLENYPYLNIDAKIQDDLSFDDNSQFTVNSEYSKGCISKLFNKLKSAQTSLLGALGLFTVIGMVDTKGAYNQEIILGAVPAGIHINQNRRRFKKIANHEVELVYPRNPKL